jgi:hypothetical protein
MPHKKNVTSKTEIKIDEKRRDIQVSRFPGNARSSFSQRCLHDVDFVGTR